MNNQKIFNNNYFIALGMSRMIKDEQEAERVMDFIKEKFSEEQKTEFIYEEIGNHLYLIMREHFAEKGIRY